MRSKNNNKYVGAYERLLDEYCVLMSYTRQIYAVEHTRLHINRQSVSVHSKVLFHRSIRHAFDYFVIVVNKMGICGVVFFLNF